MIGIEFHIYIYIADSVKIEVMLLFAEDIAIVSKFDATGFGIAGKE